MINGICRDLPTIGKAHFLEPFLGTFPKTYLEYVLPRPKSQIPAYRKHSSGKARVTINGRDYLLGPHGTKASKLEYDRLIAEYLASGRSATFGETTEAITVAMLMIDYLRYAKSYFGSDSDSELHRIAHALKPVKKLYADHPAMSFGPIQFKAVRQTLIDNGQCRTGINAQMKRVTRMFKWAGGEGTLPAAVFDTLRLVPSLRRGRTEAKESDPVKPVSRAVVDATIKKLNPVLADMVRVQYLTCCRPGEVCKLTPAMIDTTGDVWVLKRDRHKLGWLRLRRSAHTVCRSLLAVGVCKNYCKRCSRVSVECWHARSSEPCHEWKSAGGLTSLEANRFVAADCRDCTASFGFGAKLRRRDSPPFLLHVCAQKGTGIN